MLAQLNRMDQDTMTNNQFLAQRLAGMEQTFDDGLAKEINNLASDMDGIEENIQMLSSRLDVLMNHGKNVKADPKTENKGPEEDLINDIIVRLTKLEDNQSNLAKNPNPPETHEGGTSAIQWSPRDSPEHDVFEDARSNGEYSSHLQPDGVARITMGPIVTRKEDLTISITSNNHYPPHDPYTNPGFNQNKIRQGHPTEGSRVASLHMMRPDEDWLQEQVDQELLDQGAATPTTSIIAGKMNELNEWSNIHVGGHVIEQMPNGEQSGNPPAGNTDCQDQDTTPTLAPLKANLPTGVSTLMNALQDTSPSSTDHQGRDQPPSNLTSRNIALGMFYGMTLVILLHMLVPTTMYQGMNLIVRALDRAGLFSSVKCGPRFLGNYENITRLARTLLDLTARGAGLQQP